jgi:hypothetical protein
MAELQVMSHGYLPANAFCELKQLFRFAKIDRKGLLNVNMRSMFQAQLAKFKVSLGRRGYVNNVRAALLQQLIRFRKCLLDPEPLRQLLGHERFPIAGANNHTPGHPLQFRKVCVCNLAAANDPNLKHASAYPCNFGKTTATLQPSEREATTPTGFSTWHLYSASASTPPPIPGE